MIEQVITFLGLTGSLLAVLAIYAFYKAGWSVSQLKKNWFIAEGDTPISKGVIFILGIPILIGVILFSINDASAEEIKWFDSASVYVGLDYQPEISNTFCQSTGASDKIASNMGFQQNIATTSHFNVGAKYTHHSCALSPDVNTYDSIGIVIEWKIF